MATTPKPITQMLEKTSLEDADLFEIVNNAETNLSLKNQKLTALNLKSYVGGAQEILQQVYSGGGNAVTDGGTEQTLLDDIQVSAIDAARLVQFDIQTTVTGTNAGRYDVKLYNASAAGGPYTLWATLKMSFNGYGTLYDAGNISSIRGNTSNEYWRMTIQRIGGTANNIPTGSSFIVTVFTL